MKFDVRRYFDSVDYANLQKQLGRVFKDHSLLYLLGKILGSYRTRRGKGLPIGSLVSQHLANFYLEQLDRWFLSQSPCRGMVRYLDVVLVSGENRRELAGLRRQLYLFLSEKLQLECKREPFINRSCHGTTFLGTQVFPGFSTPGRKRKTVVRRKLVALHGSINQVAGDESLHIQ